MTPEKYIEQTEHAMRQYFESLSYYQGVIDSINPPIFISSGSDWDDDEFASWQDDHEREIKHSLKATEEYFGVSFSMQTICGGILQVASKGIDMYSPQRTVPPACSSFIKATASKKVIRFCAGRNIRELPLGIIVYAGRNQYNHWDDSSMRPVNTAVFDILFLKHGAGTGIVNPAFDLANPQISIYTHNIIALLEWNSYKDYEQDLKSIIC